MALRTRHGKAKSPATKHRDRFLAVDYENTRALRFLLESLSNAKTRSMATGKQLEKTQETKVVVWQVIIS